MDKTSNTTTRSVPLLLNLIHDINAKVYSLVLQTTLGN